MLRIALATLALVVVIGLALLVPRLVAGDTPGATVPTACPSLNFAKGCAPPGALPWPATPDSVPGR